MWCFHKYKEIKSTGMRSYQECSKCGKRRVLYSIYDAGYQPIDRAFMGIWDREGTGYIALRPSQHPPKVI